MERTRIKKEIKDKMRLELKKVMQAKMIDKINEDIEVTMKIQTKQKEVVK